MTCDHKINVCSILRDYCKQLLWSTAREGRGEVRWAYAWGTHMHRNTLFCDGDTGKEECTHAHASLPTDHGPHMSPPPITETTHQQT